MGAACGGLELFCIQCVVSLGPAGRKNVDVAFYAQNTRMRLYACACEKEGSEEVVHNQHS